MGFFDLFKEKITQPTTHDSEDNLVLNSGAHILNNCRNVVVEGKAIILEATDSQNNFNEREKQASNFE